MAGSWIRQKFSRLAEVATRKVEYLNRHRIALCSVGAVAFPAYYVIWAYILPQPYENLPLRLLASALFIPLALTQYWPLWARRHLVAAWHFSLLFSLPFFFIFMLLKNNGAPVWIASTCVAILASVMLLEWAVTALHYLIGGALAWLAYQLTSDISQLSFNVLEILPILAFAIIISITANYGSIIIRVEQERAMLATASSIAHELRTPLLSIAMGATGLRKFLPALLDAYRQASEHQLPVKPLRIVHLDAMAHVLDRIEKEAVQSNAIIDMLLFSARHFEDLRKNLKPCDIEHCVATALDRYPFAEKESAAIRWIRNANFVFMGNELLMVHVMFNLIKNALRHTTDLRPGAITISINKSAGQHQLVFQDTGTGITAEAIPHIFTRFYTSADTGNAILGASIGLAFCHDVMALFGGRIECYSQPGISTRFILSFPQP